MSPRLALGVECRVRRREPSTAPPHARRPRANYAHARGRRPIFPMRERDRPSRSAVDLRRPSARQPMIRRYTGLPHTLRSWVPIEGFHAAMCMLLPV